MTRTMTRTKKALAIFALAAVGVAVAALPAAADDHTTSQERGVLALQSPAGNGPQDDHTTGGADDHTTDVRLG
ncbi:hypothetical protein ACH4U6_18675 [Streptomyces netropsis]|uniref:Uncharacterized protein n=1 Tax=Streptomyces netropsis TaxID=55404 RepID=A0A7W7LBE9_STRNE|nr:hypothetical protein [Streptomyces netropsis]MBB4886927.1 hypothetical protein [Streptomyces netropsis]